MVISTRFGLLVVFLIIGLGVFIVACGDDDDDDDDDETQQVSGILRREGLPISVSDGEYPEITWAYDLTVEVGYLRLLAVYDSDFKTIWELEFQGDDITLAFSGTAIRYGSLPLSDEYTTTSSKVPPLKKGKKYQIMVRADAFLANGRLSSKSWGTIDFVR